MVLDCAASIIDRYYLMFDEINDCQNFIYYIIF